MEKTNECPLCEKKKKRAKDLICPSCYQDFTFQAGKTLAEERKIVPLPEWVKEGVRARLRAYQEELRKKAKDHFDLREKVRSEAYSELTKTLNGQRVDPGVFSKALRERKVSLWARNGGNRLHYELKTLEGKIVFLYGVLKGIRPPGAAVAPGTQLELPL